MLPKTLPRPYDVRVNLKSEEYAIIAADAQKFGVSKAEALRRNCRDFFVDTGVQRGRIPGVSPQKRNP